MNYEDMSTHQINKHVARALGVEWVAVAQDGLIVSGQSSSVDYCNNPSDAWPIIVGSRITVTPYDDENQGWSATYDTSFFIDHENPLRAAMICFLKMKESE